MGVNQQTATYDPALLKVLPTIVRAYQLPDRRKALWQVVNTFLPFFAIWAAMYFLMDVSIALTLLLGVVNGFLLVRIFIIQHDCGHQSFTPSRKLNDVIGIFCSAFSIIPYRYWAKSHNFHHGHNGLLWEHRDIGDIQFYTVEEYNQLSPFRKFRYRLFRSFPVLFILGPFYYVFIQQRLPLIRMNGWKQAHRALLRHNLLLVAVFIGLVWAFGYKALLVIHLPIIFFFGVIAVWFFYVQHQHETTYKQWRDKWDYVMAAIQGSTYYKLPRVFHWLTGNIGYHHIHHLNPLVPNYELARCHHENPVFDKVSNSITFWQSLSCIRHKLWDESQQRMISFREYVKRYKK